MFNTFTKYVQGNSYPTLNSLILFYVEIKQNLEHIQRSNVCEVIDKVIDILLQNLDNRFQLTDACIAAAILDPSSQHLPILNVWLRDKGRLCHVLICCPMELGFHVLFSSIFRYVERRTSTQNS